MRKNKAGRARWLQPGMIINFAGILLLAVAISYNALYRQAGRLQVPAGNAVHVQPDRLGKLVTEMGLATPRRSATRVNVTPSGVDTRSLQQVNAGLVYAIQRDLAALGYYDDEIDGRLGSATLLAIRKYQRSTGLSESGKPSRDLLEHLQYTRRLEEAAKFTGSLKSPAVSRVVLHVQSALAKLGYAPGEIDGVAGDRTIQAIQRFQIDRRMVPDGEISQPLIAMLNRMTGQMDAKTP